MSQTINVDMTPNSFQPSLYYSQGDIGREFKIKIVSQSGDTIPAGATVTIQATKPSGFGFSVAADSVTDGTATFTTTAEMTDEFGRFPAELKVVSGSVTIFSANFQMVGERNVHPEGTIDGSQGTIIPELTILVERVEAAASSVLDMEVEAQTLPAGSLATYSYDEDENKATFGIPQGEAGAGAAGVTASAYSASKTYAVGDYVIHNSNLYRCTTAITTAEAFTAAHWTQVVLGDDVTDVKSDLSDILTHKETTETPTLVDGYAIYTDLTLDDRSFSGVYKRSVYVPIPYGATSIAHNFRFNGSAGYIFYDAGKSAISGGNTANLISSIPTDARYIILTDYASNANHDGRTVTISVSYKSVKQIEEEIEWMQVGEETLEPTLVDGFADIRDNTISDNGYSGYYARTNYLPIPPNTNLIRHNFNCYSNAGYIFFDASKTAISNGTSLNTISTVPSNAKYIVISEYSASATHTGKTITFVWTSSLKGLQDQIDSISGAGCNITNLVTFGDSHVERGLWQGAVLSYFGISSHTNLGIGSSCVAENASATQLPFVDSTRISAIETADPDTIIIIGGTNDVHLDTPLGTTAQLGTALASKDKTTFYGAYSYLIETLLTWKPSLQIMLCTPPQGYYDRTHTVKYQDIAEAVKTIAFYYSLPVADIFGDAGVNKTNLSTYSDDLIHYNTLGNKRVSKVVITAINDCYLKIKDSQL